MVCRKPFPPQLLAAIFVLLGGISGAPARAETGEKVAAPEATSRAAQLGIYFGRPVGDILSLRDQGFGYAEITKILVIARTSRQPLPALVARHRQGYGWGTISRELGLNPVMVKRSVDRVRRDLGIVALPQ